MEKINKLFVVLFLTCFCQLANLNPVLFNDPSGNRTEDNDVMNIFQQDEPEQVASSEYTNVLIEEVKARILKNLHKKEAPKRHATMPVLQSLNFQSDSRDVAEVGQLSSNTTKRTKSEFLYANVENGSCFDDNSNPCKRFHFTLPEQVQNKEFASIELWLYKKENVTQFSITRIIANLSNGDDEEVEKLSTTVHNQTSSKGWRRFNASQILDSENMTTLVLEISTEDGEWCLEAGGNKTPFLLIRSEDRRISKRSATDCETENSTCCREIYFVHFRDIGWGDWVIQPEGFDANFCRGSCTNHVGLPQKHHGRILMALCDKNPGKARDIGKVECITCAPMAYQSMSVIYLDEEGVQVVSHMTDMSVSKCGCI